MTPGNLAETLRRGDPDRFLALMAAPVGARAKLLPLYAFNLEVARAPWLTAEPMIAEMRLQWWRDAVDEIGQGAQPRAHEVVLPLADLVPPVPPALLDDLIEARRWDIYKEPFADHAAFLAHLDRTGGNLMWAAALALGAPPEAEAPVRDIARAGALAAWLRAVPELEARGRYPLPDGRPEAIAALAREGLGWVAKARKARAALPREVVPALYPAWQAAPLLNQAAAEPMRVADGALGQSEFARRARLLWQAVTGRW